MPIPRAVSRGTWSDGVLVLFNLLHQITLWALIGSLIWIGTGKRRYVVYVLDIASGPLTIVATERHLFKSEYIVAWTARTGLVVLPEPFYDSMFELFKYAPD